MSHQLLDQVYRHANAQVTIHNPGHENDRSKIVLVVDDFLLVAADHVAAVVAVVPIDGSTNIIDMPMFWDMVNIPDVISCEF